MSSDAELAYRDFEHAGWERAAAVYADTFEAATRLFAPALLDAAQVRAGMTLLDVACGTGAVTAAAAARGAAAAGVDFSRAMIAEAAARHPTLALEEADAQALPFGDAGFDAVLIHFGVHHFPSPQRAIMQAHRVLRAGGRLAFTVWAPPAEHALHRIAIEAVRAAADAGASLPVPPQGPLNEAAACRRLLEDAGFAAPAVQTLHGVLKLDGVAELVHMMQAGTVRLSALIRSQGPVRGAAILAEIEKSAAAFCVDGGLEIPVAAILASAVK